jgi:hypothetical protein
VGRINQFAGSGVTFGFLGLFVGFADCIGQFTNKTVFFVGKHEKCRVGCFVVVIKFIYEVHF